MALRRHFLFIELCQKIKKLVGKVFFHHRIIKLFQAIGPFGRALGGCAPTACASLFALPVFI